jgi:hypothetical protein
VARGLAEELTQFDVDERQPVNPRGPAVPGDRLGATTVNLRGAIIVSEAGRVVDVWPVFPQGPGDHGFARFLAT